MLPKFYHQWIDWVGDGTGLPDTILHIHAGMALLMIARLITRRSFGTFIPWTVVAAGEAFNEISVDSRTRNTKNPMINAGAITAAFMLLSSP